MAADRGLHAWSRSTSPAAVRVLLLIAAACNSPTAGRQYPFATIKDAQAVQVMADSGPRAVLIAANTLLVTVYTEDSLLNILWRPSQIQVETSRGFVDTLRLIPPACLIPRRGDDEFADAPGAGEIPVKKGGWIRLRYCTPGPPFTTRSSRRLVPSS